MLPAAVGAAEDMPHRSEVRAQPHCDTVAARDGASSSSPMSLHRRGHRCGRAARHRRLQRLLVVGNRGQLGELGAARRLDAGEAAQLERNGGRPVDP